jgi:hypothetical protein
MQLQQQAQASQNASSKSGSGGSGSSDGGAGTKSQTPNANLQVQQLQVPDGKFDTSVHDDKTPLLDDLQQQITNLEKALQQPASPDDKKEMSTQDSIDKEIADLQSSTETQRTLIKAAETFALVAKKQRETAPPKPPDKTVADTLRDLGGKNGGESQLQLAVEDGAKLTVPVPKPSSPAPQTGGHMDTLSGSSSGESISASASNPVISLRNSSSNPN